MTALIIRGRKIYRGRRWSPIVLMCFAVGLGSMGTAVAFYLRLFNQERKLEEHRERLQLNREELRLLQERIRASEANAQVEVATPETIRSSLRRFEQEYLTDPDSGLSAIILQINKTARAAGVTLSDIAFNPIEESDLPLEGQRGGPTRGRQFYPGLKLAFTVTGPYSSIRRFLVELERGRMFLIVDALTLKSVEQTRALRRAATASGDVTLSLEVRLSVYYRRQGAVAALINRP
jgi:hypothetical protein